jgi:uncharacterized SAM-binding protein YcdF (DUF218 family)
MFFIVSKTIAFLALPSNLLIAIGLFGIVLLATRFHRAGIRCAVISLILLTLVGFSPLGNILMHVLEVRFPLWNAARGAPDGIIVLGGEISPELSQELDDTVVNGSAGRLFAMAKLAQQYPAARIVYTGGNASLVPGGPAEADFVYPLLDRFGIARNRVTLESRSRNTAENAVFTKALVNPKPGERWLLITSAWHMPRAVGSFRRAGFLVEAYPVDRRRSDMTTRRALAGGLNRTDEAIHEWIGLVAYWLTGRTGELLPGPAIN